MITHAAPAIMAKTKAVLSHLRRRSLVSYRSIDIGAKLSLCDMKLTNCAFLNRVV